jgi:hypothetical protein
MKPSIMIVSAIGDAGLFGAMIAPAADPAPAGFDAEIANNAQRLFEEGRQIFRFTFGSEAFWGDTLRLHEGHRWGGERRRRPGRFARNGALCGSLSDADKQDLVEYLKGI